MTRIAGVRREAIYSPNSVDKDAAIFDAVVERLRELGCVVNLYCEHELRSGAVTETIILNMCRDLESISMLQRLEDKGRIVINSGYGIENCTRERMTCKLLEYNIPTAKTIIIDTTATDIREQLSANGFTDCWVKRGDFHAVEQVDVSYCPTVENVIEAINNYANRGIKRAVINEHLTGDLVKFYGVQNSDFFYWFYPLESGHSKYGHEHINGASRGLKFDKKTMKRICQEASLALNVAIYGGDCVVAENGTIRIIDFNDFPSFSPCRNEVAPHIANYIINKL